jgi:hypothetical protein
MKFKINEEFGEQLENYNELYDKNIERFLNENFKINFNSSTIYNYLINKNNELNLKFFELEKKFYWGNYFEIKVKEFLINGFKFNIKEFKKITKEINNFKFTTISDGIIINSLKNLYYCLLEIKCPISQKIYKIINNKYYLQIQISLFLTNLKYYLFFEWSIYGYQLKIIKFDKEFLDEILKQLNLKLNKLELNKILEINLNNFIIKELFNISKKNNEILICYCFQKLKKFIKYSKKKEHKNLLLNYVYFTNESENFIIKENLNLELLNKNIFKFF